MSESQDIIQPAAAATFAQLRARYSVKQIRHITRALDREVDRHERAVLFLAWRAKVRLDVEPAAAELGISADAVRAIEAAEKLTAEDLRPIRHALRRVRSEMGAWDE